LDPTDQPDDRASLGGAGLQGKPYATANYLYCLELLQR
jgi:hypothetical protein